MERDTEQPAPEQARPQDEPRERVEDTGEERDDQERPAGEQRPRPRRDIGESGEGRPRRRTRGRRRACVMCVEGMSYIDYKDFGFLRRFLSDRGRIESRRKSGTCAKHQRALAQAIKRARHLALLPYTADHVRTGAAPPR